MYKQIRRRAYFVMLVMVCFQLTSWRTRSIHPGLLYDHKNIRIEFHHLVATIRIDLIRYVRDGEAKSDLLKRTPKLDDTMRLATASKAKYKQLSHLGCSAKGKVCSNCVQAYNMTSKHSPTPKSDAIDQQFVWPDSTFCARQSSVC